MCRRASRRASTGSRLEHHGQAPVPARGRVRGSGGPGGCAPPARSRDERHLRRSRASSSIRGRERAEHAPAPFSGCRRQVLGGIQFARGSRAIKRNGVRYCSPRASTAGGWLIPSPAMNRPGKASPTVRIADAVLSGSATPHAGDAGADDQRSVAASSVAARREGLLAARRLAEPERRIARAARSPGRSSDRRRPEIRTHRATRRPTPTAQPRIIYGGLARDRAGVQTDQSSRHVDGGGSERDQAHPSGLQ